MILQKVKIIGPDKCQILNPYPKRSKKIKNTGVINQNWLDWEREHSMPLSPKRPSWVAMDALRSELEFQGSLAQWKNRIIRKIANFRFNPGDTIYWNDRKVRFRSFNYNNAIVSFRDNAKWVNTKVLKDELCKYRVGSVHPVKHELGDGSLVLP